MTKASAGPRPRLEHVYAIGLGSNRPLSGTMAPAAILRAALRALDEAPLQLVAASDIIASRPVGPSLRRYANGAAVVAAPLGPLAMLDRLQAIERRFHRRRYRRWGDRTLDLDLLLWSGGAMSHKRLRIPHASLAQRGFVLDPLEAVAPHWRVPGHCATVRQLAVRLRRRRAATPA